MASEKRKKIRPTIKKLTINFYPWKLKVNSFTCTSTKPTISEQDRKSKIEDHIEKHSQAWQELAKK